MILDGSLKTRIGLTFTILVEGEVIFFDSPGRAGYSCCDTRIIKISTRIQSFDAKKACLRMTGIAET